MGHERIDTKQIEAHVEQLLDNDYIRKSSSGWFYYETEDGHTVEVTPEALYAVIGAKLRGDGGEPMLDVADDDRQRRGVA